MLIALLMVLGVDLIVIVLFAAIVLGRRRWLKRQPGQFMGALRVSSGEIERLPSTWKRGSGRWVRDVLVWSKAPLLFRDVLVPTDGISGERRMQAGEVKRLGDDPIVFEFVSDDARVEVAAGAGVRELVMGSLAGTHGAGRTTDEHERGAAESSG
jgi:Protein of unknown function (DUF2550)